MGLNAASTLGILAALLWNDAASADPNTAKTDYASVRIDGVPHIQQKPDFCGEACAAMYLQKLGEPVDQDYVFDRSGTDPTLGRGAYAAELNRALVRIGFDTGTVWQPARSKADIERAFGELHRDLTAQVPSIVCMHYSDAPRTTEHFRLILGYDAAADEVLYHEPAEKNGAYRRMSRALFQKLWPIKGGDTQTLVRMRLLPADLSYGEISDTPTAADYAQHIRKLRAVVPKGFTVLTEPPFVVIGDEAPETVALRAATTIRWTVALLGKDFFSKDPAEILDIWLFKDNDSYRTHTRSIFGEAPDTPYGYYSPKHRALVMNIATGGGTLVHEIVHPYMQANFPEAPAWLNEGLGSLYEACADRDGHIRGLPNWRLPGLKQAIRNGALPPLSALTHTTDAEFYGENAGIHYAEARYLLYYLQEHGLLVPYYHSFYANRVADPGGYETLREILQASDMDEFQSRFEAWVLAIPDP